MIYSIPERKRHRRKIKQIKTSFLFTLLLQKIAEIKHCIYKAIPEFLFIKCIYFHSLTKLVPYAYACTLVKHMIKIWAGGQVGDFCTAGVPSVGVQEGGLATHHRSNASAWAAEPVVGHCAAALHQV